MSCCTGIISPTEPRHRYIESTRYITQFEQFAVNATTMSSNHNYSLWTRPLRRPITTVLRSDTHYVDQSLLFSTNTDYVVLQLLLLAHLTHTHQVTQTHTPGHTDTHTRSHRRACSTSNIKTRPIHRVNKPAQSNPLVLLLCPARPYGVHNRN